MSPKTFTAKTFLERLWRLEAELVRQGFHPLSPWWRAQLERFVRALAGGRRGAAAAICRRWVIRAGRRAGKSSSLCRLAVAWALFGAWAIPAGDVAVVAFVSVSKDEAAARLRTIGAILRALGETYEERDGEIELTGSRHVLFKTFAATTKATVGFTSIAVFGDEVSRWESRDTAANPAAEVFGSLLPTLASQPFGFAVVCSSPWSTDDYHAQLFDAGDTDHQIVSFATTWAANPTISEDRTHELEPDHRVWSREYAAEPGLAVSAALDASDVLACYGRALPAKLRGGFVAIDPSSLRGDEFTYSAGRTVEGDGLAVLEVGGWGAKDQRHVSLASIVDTIAKRAQHWGTRTVFSDQREAAALEELFGQRGIRLQVFTWSEPSKDDAVMLLRRMMRERRLWLCEHAPMRTELVQMKARLAPSGRTLYQTSGLDYASTLITLAHAVVAGDLGEPGPIDFEEAELDGSRFTADSTPDWRRSGWGGDGNFNPGSFGY
ncbi:MAG: hypothetical protein AMXMBFR56_81760 [Polyangiaceae bacterium]